MRAIQIFTDEDVYGDIAAALRHAGVDAISTPEAGRLGQTDEEQLNWAIQAGRTIITFNVAHFASLHTHWLASGRHHAGIAGLKPTTHKVTFYTGSCVWRAA